LLAAGAGVAAAAAGGRAGLPRGRAADPRRRPLPAAGRGGARLGPVGTDRAHRACGLHLDGAAGDLRLGPGAAGPPLPLAALLHRGRVSLVHPAPEPDRAVGAVAVADAARTGA